MTNKILSMLTRLPHAVRGFTLIETLVAVLILATAIAGPLTLASKGLSTALVAKDQTIAYYLAQDAVEYLRFARDTNRLQGTHWLYSSGSGSTNLSTCVSTTGTAACYLDTLANTPSAPATCAGGVCPPLYYDPTNNYFTYNNASSNTMTIFTRTISITSPTGSNADEARVLVKVTWSDLPGITHTVSVNEDLFNWQ